MYYVGHDGHKDISVFCIQTASGNVKDTFEVPATPEGMDVLIDRMKGKRFKVLAETSTFTIDLHDYLVSKGVESYLAHPTHLKLITESAKKTDRNDSRTLADYLRLWDKGELKLSMSFIVNGDDRELRELCRLREDIAQQRGRTMQRIKAHMRLNGQYYEYEDLSTKKARTWIRTAFADDLCLMMMVDMYTQYEMQAAVLDKQLEKDFGHREDVKLLQSIPGIGLTTAAELASMIVDIRRYPTCDHLRSYNGMAPKVRDSGGSMKHGHITKRGDPMMRKVLGRVIGTHINCAPNDSIARYKASHQGSMPKSTLMVACMNKLLDLIYAVLSRGTPYVHR